MFTVFLGALSASVPPVAHNALFPVEWLSCCSPSLHVFTRIDTFGWARCYDWVDRRLCGWVAEWVG